LWAFLVTKKAHKVPTNIVIGSLEKGIKVMKPMIWVTSKQTLATYSGHTVDVELFPEKYRPKKYIHVRKYAGIITLALYASI